LSSQTSSKRQAIEETIDHQGQSLHPWLPAGRTAIVKDDRPRPVCRQLPLDLSDKLLALFLVGLGSRAIACSIRRSASAVCLADDQTIMRAASIALLIAGG
jgi:hypothetical protein